MAAGKSLARMQIIVGLAGPARAAMQDSRQLSRGCWCEQFPAGQVMLNALQVLPRDAELLAFEAGRDDYCEREVDEVEWRGGRVYLHLGARRDEPPRG